MPTLKELAVFLRKGTTGQVAISTMHLIRTWSHRKQPGGTRAR
jgi:hypothetical protein